MVMLLMLSSKDLRTPDPVAVHKLLNMDPAVTCRFKDIEYQRRSSAHPRSMQRSWYLPANMWCDDLLDTGLNEADTKWTESDEQRRLFTLPEDMEGLVCALSGEKLVTEFIADHGQYMYTGVVCLTGEDARRHMVDEGAIVKTAAVDDNMRTAVLRRSWLDVLRARQSTTKSASRPRWGALTVENVAAWNRLHPQQQHGKRQMLLPPDEPPRHRGWFRQSQRSEP
jgi:hypothetical protein